MSLASLPPLLRDEPAVLQLLGRSSAVLAVPEPARAYTIAGLAEVSRRSPIVVAVPTSGDAERLARDLATYLGEDEVDLFPAWETLPFERVSPSVETMGHRLRGMWRLRHPQRLPRRQNRLPRHDRTHRLPRLNCLPRHDQLRPCLRHPQMQPQQAQNLPKTACG